MSPKRKWFVNYQKLSTPIPVRVSNGEIIPPRGEIDFLAYDGVKWTKKLFIGGLLRRITI